MEKSLQEKQAIMTSITQVLFLVLSEHEESENIPRCQSDTLDHSLSNIKFPNISDNY